MHNIYMLFSLQFKLGNAHYTPSLSQSYLTTDSQSASLSWYEATIWDPWPIFLSLAWKLYLDSCGDCNYGAPSLMRGQVCNLHLAPGLASAVFLGSESCEIHDHILLSQFWDSPKLEAQAPVSISLQNRMGQLYPCALGSLSVASYTSHGYGGGTLTRLHSGLLFLSYDWLSVVQSVLVLATIWNPWPIFISLPWKIFSDICPFFLWGALPDERMSLQFIQLLLALCQDCHSYVQIPQNSWLYLTVSFDAKFPFHHLLWLTGLWWR
jgi:hypothetical protein